MIRPPTIEFVNHASVLLSDGEVSILSDPWYSGSVFHQGWRLLHETKADVAKELLKRVTHIWISHEHPDHFSTQFFQQFKTEILKQKIIIIFQKTRDCRVTNYLRQQGFFVQELQAGKHHLLSEDCKITIHKSDLYDSALLADFSGVKIYNLNDCPITSAKQLQVFTEKYGGCDALLTQFSYAAWKGGEEAKNWRRKAATAKINTLRRQAKFLQPKVVIPFASFSYFSNELNFYMNTDLNTPASVFERTSDIESRIVFLKPGEKQKVLSAAQDPKSLEWWQKVYKSINELPKTCYKRSYSIEDLSELLKQYQSRVFSKNSKFLMRLANSKLKLKPFGKTKVHLVDLNITIEVDVFGEIRSVKEIAHIRMHSASLAFIFLHEFGFDTLIVNGCFEVRDNEGFSKFAKSFVIGNLNSMGINVRPSMVFNLSVFHIFLKKLAVFQKQI